MLGVIGGTGFYSMDHLAVIEEISFETPFGKPSAPLARVRHAGHDFYFLPRHGRGHQLLPHEVNYRANIYALKEVGVRQVLSFSAVGSLRGAIAPGHLALPTQYLDWVKDGRPKTFFGNGLAAHVSTASPTCRSMVDALALAAATMDLPVHTGKTYVCVDGPRLGTQAESHFFRQMGCDLVGMTNVPEVFLAREAQLCYATVGLVTDYDCWKENPADHADTATIIARYGDSLSKARGLLQTFLENGPPPACPACRESLKGAVMTSEQELSTASRTLLSVLRS